MPKAVVTAAMGSTCTSALICSPGLSPRTEAVSTVAVLTAQIYSHCFFSSLNHIHIFI